jgi:hypothetical protein
VIRLTLTIKCFNVSLNFISAFRICPNPTMPLYSTLLRLLRRLKSSLEHWRAVFVKQQQVIAMVQIRIIAIWWHAISISPRKCGLARRMSWVGILYCAEWCIEIWYHFDHLCAGMLMLDLKKTNRLLTASSPHIGLSGGGYCTDDMT